VGRVGFREEGVEDVASVGVFGTCINGGVIPGSLAKVALLVDLCPCLARVFRSENATAIRFDDCPDAFGINRRNSHADIADDTFWQPFVPSNLSPGVSGVRRFEQTAAGSSALEGPWLAIDFPQRRVDCV